ncbi:CPBP family intramembrane glutamic endopeptidase [Aquimarina latercula]|uniref:CPBP family intramembrane glutamic endopeptidase n=1 Tax=Aquimarina latercula TaxID=987 RepID=UPI0003F62447|nr:type II CAAX endopeptidase family protein [Aquimarina latercula]
MNSIYNTNDSITSVTNQHQKSKKYILLVLGISWIFGFSTTTLLDFSDPIAYTIITFIYAFIPAIIAIIFNKNERGSWKDLKFFKPDLKSSLYSFIIPIIYFAVVISIQVLLDIRIAKKLDQINQTPLTLSLLLILGYPITVFLILGEEIGWRGYLQEKLMNSFGAFAGIFVLGLVWGIWHMPIALQGYNFPNHPYIEAFITYPLVGMALSLIIAYLGFNRYSIFTGALVHASNNHFGGTFLTLTETNNEFAHAMIFNGFYVIIILIFGYLWRRKTFKNIKS